MKKRNKKGPGRKIKKSIIRNYVKNVIAKSPHLTDSQIKRLRSGKVSVNDLLSGKY